MNLKIVMGALAIAAFAIVTPRSSTAAVFAGHLSMVNNGNGTYNLNYRLNEAANVGVAIRVKGPSPSTTVVRTITAGPQTTGSQTIVWDGKNNSNVSVAAGNYTWEVEASTNNAGSTAYVKTGTGSTPETTFFGPSGIDSDKTTTSPFFGRVYVTNNAGTVTGGRVTGEGVYILGNDLTDYTGQGNTAYSGGIPWTTSQSSPFRTAVTPDGDKLFICDWTDPHSGIWVMDTTTPSAPFDPLFSETPGRAASGLKNDFMHGSISGIAIEGFGANRVLYTMDEDLVDPIGTAGMTGSLWKYPVGTVTSNYASTRTVQYNDAANGNLSQNLNAKPMRDPKALNSWWFVQYRATDGAAVPTMWHYNGTAVDWNSGVDGAALQLNSGGNSTAAEISLDGNLIAVGTSPAVAPTISFRVLDVSNRSNVTVLYSDNPAGGTKRDIEFDAAGNIMMVSPSSENLIYYSKQGANTFVTPNPTNGVISVTGSAVDSWGLY